MDLKRFSSFLLTSIKHPSGVQKENNSDNKKSSDSSLDAARTAGSVAGGRRRALSSYTYSVDAKCRLVDGKSSNNNAARRSHSSRYTGLTATKGTSPYGARVSTHKLPTTPPVNKKRQPTTATSTTYATKSTTRQRAVSLPQPQPYVVDGEHLSPVQLFEKWSGGAGKAARVHYNPRWSSFKYNTEKRPLAFCNPTMNREEISDPEDRIRTFTVDGRGKLIDKGFTSRSKVTGIDKHVDDLEPGLSSKDALIDGPGRGGPSSHDHSPPPDNNVVKYKIWVAGAPEVGKTSLINQFANCELSNVLGRGDSLEDETGRIVNILVNGTEIELSFIEQDIEEIEKLLTSSNYWSPANIPDAALILYTVTNRKTFLEASDVLYHLRRPKTWPENREKSPPPPKIQITENGRDVSCKEENDQEKQQRQQQKLLFTKNHNNSNYKKYLNVLLDEYNKKCKYLPVFFVGNKIDVERQRAVHFTEGQDTAKMFHCCSFFETSVGLGHQTNELLTALLSKVNYLRSFDQNCSFCRSNLRRDASAPMVAGGDGVDFINFPAASTTTDGGGRPQQDEDSSSVKNGSSIWRAASSRRRYHHQHHHYHGKSRRSNSFTQAGPILIAFGRRLARSCEDLIAKLIG